MPAVATQDKKDQQEFKDYKNGHRSALVGAMAASILPTAPGPIVTAPVAAPAVAPAVETETPLDHNSDLVDADLVYILSQPRGHDGENEKKFNNWVITKINKMGYKPVIMDVGAVFVDVVKTAGDAPSRTLFSCHMDSVHSSTAKEPQALVYDAGFGHIMLATVENKGAKADPGWKGYKQKSGSCLGGDDGCGVWIMLKMIEAGVPGGYIFHRGEERGCISSAAIARNQEKWLKSWDHAIAFDRPKDYEVITHMNGSEVCSPEFGKALAEALSSEHGDVILKYETSSRGLTTDTRQYREMIPECTNIGVGYYGNHTDEEYVDYAHLKALKDQCLKIDWAALPVKRKAEKEKWAYSGQHSSGYHGSGSTYPKAPAVGAPVAAPAAAKTTIPKLSTLEALYNAAKDVETIMDWFEMDPELTANVVMQALIEGRMAQIHANMILSKTLKAD